MYSILKPLFEASLLILLDAKLRLGLHCVFELMNCEYTYASNIYEVSNLYEVGLHADNGQWIIQGTEAITFHQYISSKD